MTQFPPADKVAQKVVELLGGPKEATKLMEEEFDEVNRRWSQNTDTIGRILRAHLFVEHFLSAHLQAANPQLGSLDKVRLTFAQKVALLDPLDSRISEVRPGVMHLNAIRNRLAHRLDVSVTEADMRVFLQAPYFASLRLEGAKPGVPPSDPLEVLEAFAKYAAASFSHRLSKLSQAFAEALRVVASDAGA